jgi:hypothetical protein
MTTHAVKTTSTDLPRLRMQWHEAAVHGEYCPQFSRVCTSPPARCPDMAKLSAPLLAVDGGGDLRSRLGHLLARGTDGGACVFYEFLLALDS